MFFTKADKKTIKVNREDINDLRDLIYWGHVSDSPNKTRFFNHIRCEIGSSLKKEGLDKDNFVSKDEFYILLNHLGIELKNGKHIVKTTKGKK